MTSHPATLEDTPIRLTALAHGGGCGCKLSPSVLRALLDGQMAATGFAELLVGNGQSDDAAVWALDPDDENGRCLVATTDFFMPVVDDPHDFGRIAATNAISDIYAMGALPLFALAILGMPLGKVDTGTVRQILAGGAAAARLAGIPRGGRALDRQRRADLWPRGDRRGRAGQSQDQCRRPAGRCADPHQAAGRGYLLRRLQAKRAERGGLRRPDRHHHEAQCDRHSSGRIVRGPRADRRDRFRAARSTRSRWRAPRA